MPSAPPPETPERPPDAPIAGLTSRAITGFAWSVTGTALYYAVTLATLVVLARLLEPRDYGVLAGAVLVANLASLICDLGVGPALVQREEIQPGHVASAFYASFAFGLILTVVASLAAPSIAVFFSTPELRSVVPVLSILFALNGTSTVARAFAQRALLFRKLAMIRTITEGILYGIVAIAAALAGADYWSLVIAQLVATSASVLWLIKLSSVPLRHPPRWRHLRELLNYGGGLSLARLINFLGREGDTIVVARTFDTASIGLYTRAFRLMVLPATLIGAAMDEVLFPVLSRARASKDAVATGIERAIVGLAIVAVPTSLILAILAPEIVAVLLGPGWEGAAGPFRVLALGLYFRIAYKMGGAVTLAEGAVYGNAARQGVYALFTVAGSIVGARYGLDAVALAVVVALAIHFYLMWSLGARSLGVPFRRLMGVHLEALPAVAFVTATVAAAATGLRLVGATELVVLAGTGIVAAAAGAVVAWPARSILLGPRGRWWVDQVARMVRRAPLPDPSQAAQP